MRRDSPKERRWQLMGKILEVFAELANGCSGCFMFIALLLVVGIVVGMGAWWAFVRIQ